MIVIMKPQATARQTDEVMQMLITSGMQVQMNRGTQCTVLGGTLLTELLKAIPAK